MISAVTRSSRLNIRVTRARVALGAVRRESVQAAAGTAAKAAGIGVAAGGLGSLVGMGGAFIALPFLTGVLGLSQHKAHGTSMAAVLATGFAGCISYSSGAAVDWVAAGTVAATGAVAAVVGARMASRLSEHKLKRLLALFMMGIAPTVPIKQRYLEMKNAAQAAPTPITSASTITNSSSSADANTDTRKKVSLASVAKLSTIGICTGLLAGLFGVGGGAVTVPALSLFLDMDYHQAVGTSLAAMVPTAFTGAITHFRLGNVILQAAVPLAAGTATGAYIGGLYGLAIPSDYLTWFFAVMMMGLGVRTWRGASKLKVAAEKLAAAKR